MTNITAQSASQVSNTASTEQNTTTVENNNNNLGKDAFLELLVTQLKYQDPLSPMGNEEFIAQMAQFSSLEQMQNMNTNMEQSLRMDTLSQGAALVGRTIETIDSETGLVLDGKVEKVVYEGGNVYAYLDNELIVEMSDIVSIT